MDNYENLKNLILNGQPVRISTTITSFSVIGSAAVILLAVLFIGPPVFHSVINAPKPGIGISFLFMILLVSLVLYQLVFAAHADLTGRRLTLSKLIGPAYEIDVDQVEKISSFRLRGTIYTNLKFRDDMGILHRALILNSNSLFFGRDVPSGILIKLAQTIK